MRATAFVVVLSMVLLSTVALADVPGLINYQGTLTDTGGVALDTTVSMTFAIYTDSTGGTQVWTETQSGVVVSHGIFNVLLGRVNAITDTVFKSTSRWLGVQVGADPELQPRQRIASVGYAFEAAEADTADYARNAFAVSDSDWTISGNNMYSAVPGSVAVGTTTPAEKFHVAGSAKVDSTLFASKVSSNSPLQLQTVGTTRIYIDDTSGNVGIGMPSPAEKLDVAGTAQMTGFRMPTGASASYVLTSDAVGVGTWQPAAGDNDWTGAGTGFMYATFTGDKVAIGRAMPASGSKVEMTDGTIDVNVINPANDGLEVNSPTTGHGVKVSLSNVANTNDGVHSITDGTGFGVYGRRQAAPVYGSAKKAGVGGESSLARGVAGCSDSSDGVYGKTSFFGTFGGTEWNIVGGVHGEPADVFGGDADNFAVVGTKGEYSSTGVLGIGGMKGHGVVGIPGGHDNFTTAGVRGITREGSWPPANFPLTPIIVKEEVGVLGQAGEYVGVWGESIYKMGVVGTVGRQLQYVELLDSAGVYGYSDISYGVIGEADLEDSSKAGVQAVGDGVDAPGMPRAAALEIRNGALRVSGANRPAGTITFIPSWTPIKDEMVTVICSCPAGCTHDPHNHIYAYYDTEPIINNLIVSDSIILLTVKASEPIFAQVVVQNPGAIIIQVTAVTPPPPPDEEIKVYYQIINPFPPGQ